MKTTILIAGLVFSSALLAQSNGPSNSVVISDSAICEGAGDSLLTNIYKEISPKERKVLGLKPLEVSRMKISGLDCEAQHYELAVTSCQKLYDQDDLYYEFRFNDKQSAIMKRYLVSQNGLISGFTFAPNGGYTYPGYANLIVASRWMVDLKKLKCKE